MEQTLKVLMIGTDRNLLTPGSAVLGRIKEYGKLVGELHIVLLSDSSHGFQDKQLDKNVWVYPTNSFASILRPLDAARLGKKLIFEKKFVRGKSIITTQDPFECGWAGMKIKKKWRIPLEVQLHTNPFSPYFKGFQNTVRKFFAKKVLRQADSVRVVAGNLKSQVQALTKADISILPVYVDRELIEQGKIVFDTHARFGWQFVLLTVSRLTPEKNLGLALKVLAGVRKKFPSTGLVIVGAGPEESHLKALTKELGLEGYVAFEGWQKDLASYYKTANLFLQTSFFEGNSLALVEAGLSSLPIVMTPVGIANELENGKDAYIYPSANPELFINGIIDLIENNYKRENLCMNMKKTLESKLLSKDDYMAKMKDNWEKTALKIKL